MRNNNVKNCRNGFFFDGNLENPSEFSYNYSSGCFTAGFQIVASDGHSFLGNVSENNGVGLTITEGSLIIERNTFNNNSVAGIRMAGTPELVGNNIQFNYITNNFVGIALTDPNAGAVNNQAHYNSFTGNVTNIGNAHAANFNATCNWYGTATQAAIDPTIIGPITYVPFLISGTDLDLVTEGFQPDVTSCVLPVTLSSFTATPKNYDVVLNWQTESEVNSSHFIIERSIDGRNFSYLGRVEAKGFSDTRVNYSLVDNKPIVFDRPVFYRLKIIDRDATYKFSEIVSAVLKTAGSYVQNVFPSPVKSGEKLVANYISSGNDLVAIALINSVGQTTLQRQVQVTKGVNRIELFIPAGMSGIHYLVFRAADGIQKVPVAVY